MKSVETRLLDKMNYHSIWILHHWRVNFNASKFKMKFNEHLKTWLPYELIWEQRTVDGNTLMLTGQEAILSAFFATAMTNFGAPPANLYLALDSRASIADTDTLATLVELSKSGYARKALASGGTGAAGQDFYINKPAAYYRADSKVVEWTAGEDWITGQKNISLCTDLTATTDAASKHLIASLALTAARTLMNGDKLDGSMYIGLSN
jgi:hypothetical protein